MMQVTGEEALSGPTQVAGPWRPAREVCPPRAGEVHIWRAPLDPAPARVAVLYRTLAADEQERAGRFCLEAPRRRFIVARGLLRALLSACLGLEPERVPIACTAHGKPVLASAAGGPPLHFNLAHAGELALVALSADREVGVDLEFVRPELAGEEIAERFFSPSEAAALRTLPPEARVRAFFSCWTRKEAYLKARGEGLSLPLDRFTVSLSPGRPAALLDCRDDPEEALRWTLVDLPPGPGYVGAAAARGAGWQPLCWQWMP